MSMANINTERSGSSLAEVEETIRLNELDDQDGFLIRDDSTLVNIYPSRSGQKAPVTKLKVRNLVDYGWEQNEGNGRLVSTHISGKYIAYVVKVANVGAVRVVDLLTNERVLLKGTKGLIKDVEFIHKLQELVVGFIDEYGSFYVYKIVKDSKTQKLQTHLLIQVELEGAANRLDNRRFIWCKFVPDEETDAETPRDCAYHFVVLQNDMVYVSNLIQIVQKFGEGKHSMPMLKGYYMTIDVHSDTVFDASFAPDGTALATAGKDGCVKFFQVYVIGEESPRCLYSWAPHDGHPVTRILFLDDHSTGPNGEAQYWKYMLTAGPNQSEIKLWTCKTWKCLQTLKFNSPMPSTLRMEVDIRAQFLVMSDLKRKVMFVLRLEHNDNNARFAWVNEFSLPTSILSFNVIEGHLQSIETVLATHELASIEEFDRNGDHNRDSPLCVIAMYFIQHKSLQQGKLIFFPPAELSEVNGRSPSRISFDKSVSYNDDKPETPSTRQDNDADGDDDDDDDEDDNKNVAALPPTKSTMNIGVAAPIKSQHSINHSRDGAVSPRNAQASVSKMTQQLSNLMGLVSEGGRRSREGSVERGSVGSGNYVNKTPDMIQLNSPLPSFGLSQMSDNHILSSDGRPRTTSINGNDGCSNASSSPSREVEEILSPKNTDLIGRRSQTSQSMEGVMNNLDVEGNVVMGIGDLPPSNKTRHGLTPPRTKTLSGTDLSPQLPQVLEQVSSILDMMKTQASEMKELKREVSRMNAVQALNPQQMDERGFAKVLDKYFTSNQVQMRRIEDSIAVVQSQDKLRLSQTQLIAPNLSEVLAERLGRVIKSEIELSVLPNVMKMLEPTKTHLQHETLKLIQAAEGRIKHEFKQSIAGQSFKDALTPGIEKSMSAILEGVVSNIFRATIIPNFEKSLQSMFVKINDTFLKGTKEYISGLETAMDSRRSQQDSSSDVLKQEFSRLQDSLAASLQVELEAQLQSGMANMQVGLVRQVEETMGRELNKAFGEQQRYLECSVVSRTATPANSLTEQQAHASHVALDKAAMKRQVMHLFEKGEIEAAFIQAAKFGDGATVLEMAEKVDPLNVFTNLLPLQTSMYIIQLFVVDLHINTATKIKYLHSALGLVNFSHDKKMVAAIARIVPIFHLSARTYLATHPDTPQLGNLKILEMAFAGHAGKSQTSALTSPNYGRQKQPSQSQQLFGFLKQEKE